MQDTISAASEKIRTQLSSPTGWFYGCVAVAVPVTTYILRINQVSLPAPFEDAAMLFRYAENLAAGHGVVWNAGDSPGASDGATDLLFVLVLGALIRLGMTSTAAALAVNLLAVFGIGYIIYAANKKVWHFPPVLLLPIITTSLLGPTWSIIAGGFSGVIFGFLLSLTFVLTLTPLTKTKPLTRIDSLKWGTVVGIISSAAGWWRPEGFLLAPLAVAAGLYAARRVRKGDGPIQGEIHFGLVHGSLVFASFVALWLAVRLLYFGALFPSAGKNKIARSNPWETLFAPFLDPSARTTIAYYVTILAPVLVVVMLIAARNKSLVLGFEVLFVIYVAAIVWEPFSLTFNWWGRVYWPLVPLSLLILLTLTATTTRSKPVLLGGFRQPLSVLSVIGVLGTVLWSYAVVPSFDTIFPTTGQYFESPFHTSVYRAMLPLDTSEVRVATTEAGLIPLAVKNGYALDTWVHNTRAISENGAAAIGPAIQEFAPNMLVAHGRRPHEFLGTEPCNGPFSTRWQAQVDIIYGYAIDNGFRLIKSFETAPCDTWNIFVSDAINPSLLDPLLRIDIDGSSLR